MEQPGGVDGGANTHQQENTTAEQLARLQHPANDPELSALVESLNRLLPLLSADAQKQLQALATRLSAALGELILAAQELQNRLDAAANHVWVGRLMTTLSILNDVFGLINKALPLLPIDELTKSNLQAYVSTASNALKVAHETVMFASASARTMLSLTVKAFTAVRSLAFEVVKATAKALNKEDVVAAVPAPMDQEEEREKVEDKQKGKDKA